MDITEMLGLLVLDLKMTLGTEISVIEGTRAIQRAVEELSRHIPRERIYEHIWDETVSDDSFTTPTAADPIYLVNAWNIQDPLVVKDGSIATLAHKWLDMARPIKMTLTDANDSITQMTLIIKGIGSDGTYREERLYRFNGKIQTGKIYFLAIYEIEVNEIAGNGANDILSVGTDSPSLATGGVWIQLDNPISVGSEEIYSAASKTGTKYIQDIDYEMDYANGRIRMKSATTMVVSTTYYANYNRAATSIDISGILPELLRIVKVLSPAGKVPEQSAAFTIWENMLTIGSLGSGKSQTSLTDGDHLTIYYESKHLPPTLYGPGTYPEFLDDMVLVGAAGFSLLMEALQHEQMAVTDLTSMRTELGKVTALVTPTTGKIDLALIKVSLYMETYGSTDNAIDVLANITDVGERSKVLTALDATYTTLGLATTNSLDRGSVGAEAYLDTGDDTINTLNVGGPDVAPRYAEFSRTRAQIALARIQQATAYAQEAATRLDNIRSYIEEAAGWTKVGETFMGEAQTLVAEVNAILSEASRYYDAAQADLVVADRFRAEAQSRLNEFRAMLGSRAEYRKRIVSTPVRQPA